MNTIKLELARRTIPEKLALGATHAASMTGNTHYPATSRVPTDAQLQAAQDNLITASNEADAAEAVWRQKQAARDAREQELDSALVARASWCEAMTPGDTELLTSTGFPLRAERAPIGLLSAPATLTVEPDDAEGQMLLRCQVVDGAKSYEWQCRPQSDGATWSMAKSSSASRTTLSGLTPGALHVFRVRALGAAGPSAWSVEVNRRAP